MLRDASAIVDTALPDILPNAQHRLGMGRCCFHSCCLACQLLQDFHQADKEGLGQRELTRPLPCREKVLLSLLIKKTNISRK